MSGAAQGQLTLNHCAFTVPYSSLRGKDRERLRDFFTTVFGLTEREIKAPGEFLSMTTAGADEDAHEPGNLFVVFIGHDKPATANPGFGGDHFGFQCTSMQQFNRCLDGVKEFVSKDQAKEFKDYQTRDVPEMPGKPAHKVHSFYIVPPGAAVACEVQYDDSVPSR
jgi:hypothetical protein